MKRYEIPMVWDPQYCTPAAPLTSTTKQANVVEALYARALVERHRVPALQNGWEKIKQVHAPAYVEAVRTGEPRALAESQGFEWSPLFAESVRRIWCGHTRACALAIANQGPVLHPVSGAHHARYARGGGFCTFNYLVGAPRELEVERVLNVDLDAHYGDGTDDLTKDDPRVFHFDLAASHVKAKATASPRGFWGEARLWKTYRDLLMGGLPSLLDRVQPQLVQYQAGMDVFAEDPLGGIEGMWTEQCRERDRFVFDEVVRKRRLPLVVTLAGGYIPGVTEMLHVNTVRELAAVYTEVRNAD